MTLHGLGGCGKSALALEFAYRALSRLARRLVFWVPAISRESFELAYRDIATRLRLHGITDGNKDINKLVKDTLNSENFGSWLMIVDNADDPKVLSDTVDGDPKLTRLVDYLPHSSRGAILFTTRSRKAAGSLTPGYVLELKDMTQAEARQLLTQRTMKPILLQDDIAVNELLEILTCLPLAIVQAAAFLSNNDISVRKYISLFRNPGAEIELFSEQFEDPSRYREMDSTIAKTWHISFDQMRKQDQLAADYLSFMACINRINIPQSLLPPNGSLVQQAKALGTLTGYAFITERQQMVQRVDGERFFDMHRLVHMASVSWLDGQGKRATWADIAADRLMKLVPHSGHERKEVWMPYISHAMHSAGLEGAVKEISRASLLRQVGGCQMSLGQYSAAEATCRRASPLYRKVMGPEHPETLRSINNLAEVLYNQGKYEETESMERQVLAQRERLLGSEHPDTLSSKSNLARVLDMQGEYEEAELMNRQALAQREIILGPEHPDTLTSMGNLAIVISNQGKNEEAELMHRQVLAKRETVLGPEHPDTLKSMNSLAIVIGNQGKYEEAELMHRQVLAQKERLLWPEHPDMLTSMNSLAIVISNQGKYEEAELMHRQVIALRERLLGSEHPDTLGSKSNLAGVLYRQGKYEEVELIERQVLAQRERLLGSEHPDALTSMNNLALAIVEQGRYEEAEVIHRQVLAQRKIALGPEHPVTLSSIGNLAVVLYRQGKYEETESMERQVLAQRERLLGSEHPDTLRSISNLARVLDRQEKYEEAEVIHRQVLGHQERVLRLKHPATLMSVYWLAYNLASQQRYDESLALYERAYTGFCTVLGNDHPTTRECLHFYAEAKKQAALSTLSPYILDNGVSRY
jgi:tetratricopeptide (TPR) repeat protein